jgi:hypothetical protein
MLLRKWSSFADKRIYYYTTHHVRLEYSIAIMRSATIFLEHTIQQRRLAYSFDAQNIVSGEDHLLLSS